MLAPHPAFHLLINNKSGSVLKAGEEDVRRLIASSGMAVKSLNMIEPGDVVSH